MNPLSTFSSPPNENLKHKMMNIWSWICELQDSDQWTESQSSHIFELASIKSSKDDSSRSIQLIAKRTVESNLDTTITFSVCLHGFESLTTSNALWVSDTCNLNSDKPFLPLLLQLIQEVITRSPSSHTSSCPRSQLQKLKPDPISWIMDSHSPESFSSFFNLVFVTRLFWLCVCDAPSEVGSLYFESILGPCIQGLSCKHAPVLRTFFVTVGVDTELCFMRTVGYILAKWLILRELGVGLQSLLTSVPRQHAGFSYAVEANGFWVLKGYAPILGMKLLSSKDNICNFSVIEAKESVLKYALAHQQLEAVIQFEYSVAFYDSYIQVNARVDNIRFHVVKLGFNKDENVTYHDERHFVSRARIWVGPEVGATYVLGLSLGQSTHNGEREVEVQRAVKGNMEKSTDQKVKTRTMMSTRTKVRNWRWDQDVEGNAVVFDAVLHNNVTGEEVATSKFVNRRRSNNGLRNRYEGPNRAFTKMGGVVFAGDEYGEGVGWRVSREMEGSVLKWRIGGHVWVSYCPNEVETSYYETRRVEWCDEVDLPLILAKQAY